MLKPRGYQLHWLRFCSGNPERREITAPYERVDTPRQSMRGRQRRGSAALPEVLAQLPQHPGGAWSYYIRDDEHLPEDQKHYPATINETLSVYPNGGSPGSRRYGRNAEYYHSRMLKRGWKYVGGVLTKPAVQQLVATMEANRPDYARFLGEEITDINTSLDEGSGLSVEQRDQARRRKAQLEGQLRMAKQPLNAAAMTKELSDIAEAQALAGAFNPGQLAVLKGMIGSTVAEMAAQFGEDRLHEVSDDQEPIKANHIDLE
jgi:hypothetical protein